MFQFEKEKLNSFLFLLEFKLLLFIVCFSLSFCSKNYITLHLIVGNNLVEINDPELSDKMCSFVDELYVFFPK